MSEEALWAKIHELERRLNSVTQFRPDRSIYAFYQTNTAQSMTNNDYTRVNFEDKVIDTHNAVTVGASWVFTAPASLVYIAASGPLLAANNGFAAGEAVSMRLYKNDAAHAILGRWVGSDNATPTNQGVGVAGCMPVQLNTGDTISFWLFQNSGGAINLEGTAVNNWCAILGIQ